MDIGSLNFTNNVFEVANNTNITIGLAAVYRVLAPPEPSNALSLREIALAGLSSLLSLALLIFGCWLLWCSTRGCCKQKKPCAVDPAAPSPAGRLTPTWNQMREQLPPTTPSSTPAAPVVQAFANTYRGGLAYAERETPDENHYAWAKAV